MIKKEARKIALANRKLYNVDLISNKIVEDLYISKVLDKYDNIGIYYPIGKEINIMGIMNKYPNKNFYLPITKEEIAFVKYNSFDILYDGLFNTKEPKGEIINRDLIDCFIIPCVAISKDGKRLGYGKGYYDRYLLGYKGYKIGICYIDESNLDINMDEFDVIINKKIVG